MDEVAIDRDVLAAELIPENKVKGIEGTVGDDRLIAQLAPVHAVGGDEGDEDRLTLIAVIIATPDRLVALVGGSGRISVEERGKIVRAALDPNDVVNLRALELEQADVGPGPSDTVGAFRVAGELVVAEDAFFVRADRGLDRVRRVSAATVVHAVLIAVLEDGGVAAGAAFPRLVEFKYRPLRSGFVQL